MAQVVLYITTHTTWKLSLSLEQRFSYIDKREYKDIFFEVLRECTTWTSRDGAVQIFFSETNHKYFCRKMCKMSVFWLCCGIILFTMLSELRFVKWARLSTLILFPRKSGINQTNLKLLKNLTSGSWLYLRPQIFCVMTTKIYVLFLFFLDRYNEVQVLNRAPWTEQSF